MGGSPWTSSIQDNFTKIFLFLLSGNDLILKFSDGFVFVPMNLAHGPHPFSHFVTEFMPNNIKNIEIFVQ